ncbi:replication factor A2 [Monoraphidium neglectum]|uniref:Replication factor A2 n=1 Tax=Monoraphidium neglectum TaxID=145388 RepID=A0A0D2MVP9_9CHLO|nr:replication factor A2 [Monoraphidium neglectum]KIZ06585.1 replication factor A2 [Monoraphidium neglectum]|eukprot:XP_013905604.1 replication factor A2 [Monoraphidium neglectum]
MYGGGGFDQFGGGGFVPTQQQDPAQGGGGGSGGRLGSTPLPTPNAPIRMLCWQAAANIPSDQQDLIVDGFDLSNVTVVGKVLSIAERGGSLDLRVSDGTGATDLQFFGDAVEDPQACAQKLAEWRPGTYVRAIGHVRTFNGSRSVQAFSIRPIHDFNEVTYHYLQAIFQHLHLLKGGGTGAGD